MTGKKLRCSEFLVFPQCAQHSDKRELHSHKIISWNQLFSNICVAALHSRNFNKEWMRVNFCNTVHSVEITEFYCHYFFLQNFRENDIFLQNFTLNWFDERILHGSEFLVFPQCAQHSVEILSQWKNISSNQLFI